jgi:hypothetical protein
MLVVLGLRAFWRGELVSSSSFSSSLSVFLFRFFLFSPFSSTLSTLLRRSLAQEQLRMRRSSPSYSDHLGVASSLQLLSSLASAPLSSSCACSLVSRRRRHQQAQAAMSTEAAVIESSLGPFASPLLLSPSPPPSPYMPSYLDGDSKIRRRRKMRLPNGGSSSTGWREQQTSGRG